jgi:O-methyltransferase
MNKKFEEFCVNFYLDHPKLRGSMNKIRNLFFPIKPSFSGWGIQVNHDPPWIHDTNSSFNQTSNDLKKNFQFGAIHSTGIDTRNVDTLLWRHWIVSYATKHAMTFCLTDEYDFVECGVGDGISSFYTLREINLDSNISNISKLHLYDSWGPMKKDGLLQSESSSLGRYSELELDVTKKNLKEFENMIIYHKGYIPEIFDHVPKTPSSIVYLHIDLNSTPPTIDTLEYFFPKLISGGVILFDDYGWRNHKDTKDAIDKFFKNKPGILLHLPTAQAIFFKN